MLCTVDLREMLASETDLQCNACTMLQPTGKEEELGSHLKVDKLTKCQAWSN